QDVGDLRGRLALAEHHLRKTGPQVAVRVDARELQRLERKLAQLLQGVGDRRAVRAHGFEKRLQTFRVHDVVAVTLAPLHGRARPSVAPAAAAAKPGARGGCWSPASRARTACARSPAPGRDASRAARTGR